MKKLILIAAVASLATALNAAETAAAPAAPAAPAQTAQPAPAQPALEPESGNALDKLSVSASVGYESEYVFRGERQTSGSLQAKVELGYELGAGNLYAGAWTNQPIASGEWNELDLYVGYAFNATDELTLDVGYLHYWYPNTAFGTGILRSNELAFGASYDTTNLFGFNLSPAVYYYYDWNCESHTVEFSISYSYDLEELVGVSGLALEPSLYVGWNTTGMPEAEWGDVSSGTDTDWSSGFYYGAALNVTYQLNDFVGFYAGIRWAGKTYTNEDSNNNQCFWGGCGVTFGL